MSTKLSRNSPLGRYRLDVQYKLKGDVNDSMPLVMFYRLSRLLLNEGEMGGVASVWAGLPSV